jgi:hypothetical protein
LISLIPAAHWKLNIATVAMLPHSLASAVNMHLATELKKVKPLQQSSNKKSLSLQKYCSETFTWSSTMPLNFDMWH